MLAFKDDRTPRDTRGTALDEPAGAAVDTMRPPPAPTVRRPVRKRARTSPLLVFLTILSALFLVVVWTRR